MKHTYRAQQQGMILVTVIVFSVVAITMTIGLVNWGGAIAKSVYNLRDREQALQIAEAGIDYYRWHLAHAPTDFYDGTGSTTTMPYTHSYTDKDGTTIGTYALTITAPSVGSTVVTIVSKGTVAASGVSRSIKVTMAIPSFAQYAAIANDNMRFGSGTVTRGPIQSNGGIHYDGVAYGAVSSALSTYTDPDYNATRWAVYTTSGTDDPNPPTALPNRADVFTVGRQLTVPAVDFSALTANISQLRTSAQSGGVYLTQSQYGGSSALGYHIVLKTNNTFDLYVVRATDSASNSCSSNSNSNNYTRWGLWTIKTQSSSPTNYPIPSNGIIFVEDDVWVDGTINGSRVTIVAAKLPDPGASSRPHITVNSNLRYTKTDGTDVIGLIAQGNINVGYGSSDTLSIDAALVAQNGRVGRYYYASNCGSSYTRSTLNLYGMIATNQRYGFAFTDGTGYDTRNISYDSNLLYGPPPSFPLTSSYYSTLSWQEI